MLWYADLRGFTRISDVTSGAQIVEMLNEIFEMLTASLRTRGGHVLKFIGDAMLATISFEEAEEGVACNRGLEAAMESSEKVESRNLQRRADGLPFARVDIALHVGEVLYGNVGAADRLDFTVIGPAVNEVVRMEKLCDMLGRHLLFPLGSPRPRDAATDAWNSSNSSSFGALASPKRSSGCGFRTSRPQFIPA